MCGDDYKMNTKISWVIKSRYPMMRQIKGGIIKETVNKKLNYEELPFLFILCKRIILVV